MPPPSPSHLPSPLYPPSLRPWYLFWPLTLPSLPGKGRLHILYLYLCLFAVSLSCEILQGYVQLTARLPHCWAVSP